MLLFFLLLGYCLSSDLKNLLLKKKIQKNYEGSTDVIFIRDWSPLPLPPLPPPLSVLSYLTPGTSWVWHSLTIMKRSQMQFLFFWQEWLPHSAQKTQMFDHFVWSCKLAVICTYMYMFLFAGKAEETSALNVASKPAPTPATQTKTKDDAYDQFMMEMAGLIWCARKT